MANRDISRRDFVKLAGAGLAGLGISNYPVLDDSLYGNTPFQNKPKKIIANKFSEISSPDYFNISHNEIGWENISEGLDFSRTNVYRDKKLVDIISAVKINPDKNKFRVFSSNALLGDNNNYIEDWQQKTNALVMVNGSQYMSNFSYSPCALLICDGEQRGPKYNKSSRGMFLAEPNDLSGKLKKADLLDFEYDSFDYKTTPYLQGVQHWPILLDRNGKIKSKNTSFQSNRTVVAKTKEDEILFITTEGDYFTLYNFGRFFKESNQRGDKGYNIHTAMNLDGGYATNMIIKTPEIDYINNCSEKIPNVMGIFKRD